MPKTSRTVRRTGLTAALAAASLALSLTGCAHYDAQSPKSAREAAYKAAAHTDGKAGTGTQGALPAGAVDCRKAKCIALTFDAGPSEHTPALLKVLAEKKVRVTFFLLGHNHVDKYPDLVKQMAQNGNVLGNHSWTHPRLTDLRPAQIRAELDHLDVEVERLTGKRPTLMRPPQGRTDAKVSKVCKELGLAQVLWNDTASDYATTDSALIHRRILKDASRDGIILLHDLYAGTVPAVPGIIDALRAQGYTFVTVPELLAPAAPEPGKVYRP
ncbi:polysaccharide deacetylase family protein [Actinacidiphila paucisporea]|uniref:Peptidoglycan/xylan/chitin deacetylase, PgdA/CDA1 family n=1 Tax=Actinacidiphila paucisporea TaxID=310782 RepID=A0A1M7J2G4_9ACTN|nr:polysaccharide deacetylase family protein [Actinacidiphila paucisporea]SHM47102.1 Peptidoglycan/xylan/chitin deacetylase, PgdA/CDA1 family [Actinacidiphila paucisporea]